MKRRDFVMTTASVSAATLATGVMGGVMADGVAAENASDGIRAMNQPWPVRGSESFEIDSKAVGDTMAVGVWQPDPQFLARFGSAADQPLQLVYVLDGSWALGMAASICTLQLVDLVRPGFPPLLLVGVDYPTGATNARSRDYTMAGSVPAAMAEGLAASPKTKSGGADNFLKFLEDELDPFIRSKYDTQGKTAGILGDSFGGTFTFYAFSKQSRLFDRYWLGSPGIFTTDTDHVARFEKVVAGDLINDTKMFLSFGELEANGGVDFYEDMGRNFNRIASSLNKNPNDRLDWKSKVYPGHTHTTVLAPAINDALLYLYGPHSP